MVPAIILALALPCFLVAGHEQRDVSESTKEATVTSTTFVTSYITKRWTNSSAPYYSYLDTNVPIGANATRPTIVSTVIVDVTQTTTIFVSPTTIPSSVSSQSPAPPIGSPAGSKPVNGKRGLAYNDAKYTKNFGGPNSPVTWQYNWNSQPYAPNNISVGMMNPSLKFLPLLWSLADELTSVWHVAATTAIHHLGADALLAYNEPDFCKEGAGASCILNITAAAQGYKDLMSPYYKTGIKLGMPAVTNGPTGIPWAKKFLELCSDCQIDIAPMHFYTDPLASFDYFTGYVKNFTEFVKPRKVWITEFGLNQGMDQQNVDFLKQAMEWLDQNDDVERYAYFWAGPKSLCNDDGSLTALGKMYNE